LRDVVERIERALGREEIRVERFVGRVRIAVLAVIAVVAALNAHAVSMEANLINFGALASAFGYGVTVSVLLARHRYRPVMKYVTSMADVSVVHAVLFLYTTIEIPAVALKNPAFLAVFPILALTVFRYDPRLTLASGAWAISLYAILFTYVSWKSGVAWAEYAKELFAPDATVVGQMTKILILAVYVAVCTYLAAHTRWLFRKLVRNEVHARYAKESMERELELASQVQSHLLPRSHPAIEGLELDGLVIEGRSVGGDYYDFIPLPGGPLFLLVADVAGKGVQAALIMAEVRAASHLFASMHVPLEEFIGRLNHLLYESTPESSYVTLFAAEIDPARESIRYINAGHPPPLLCQHGRVRRLSSGTPPVGLFRCLPPVHTQHEQFPPGCLLIACTDGVWERSNPSGEQFGDVALENFLIEHAALDAGSVVRHLLNELKSFGDGRAFEDDVTLAVAKHSGPIMAAARVGTS
jgi:hypothetical protein